MPRRPSAAVRSPMPSNATMSRHECHRAAATVSGPRSGGSVASTDSRGETGAGFIGPHGDDDFAADAMRADDLADGNLHARVPG